MKNTEKNKIKWVEKVRYTLELGGKSNRTFDNYKSHINRLLNYYEESIEINKLSEDDVVDYFRKQYIGLNRKIQLRLTQLYHNPVMDIFF